VCLDRRSLSFIPTDKATASPTVPCISLVKRQGNNKGLSSIEAHINTANC
jgi:hypothetical protein